MIGAFGEEAACKFLENKGFTIKERNFRAGRVGELDIIAQYEDTLCFIEVKTRKNLNFGSPAESVTYSKIRNIKLLSQIYMKKLRYHDIAIRFDIIEVYITGNRNSPVIKEFNHIEGAF